MWRAVIEQWVPLSADAEYQAPAGAVPEELPMPPPMTWVGGDVRRWSQISL